MYEKHPARYISLAAATCLGMSALLLAPGTTDIKADGAPIRPDFCAISSDAILEQQAVAAIADRSCQTTSEGFFGRFNVALHDGQGVTVMLRRTAHAALSTTVVEPSVTQHGWKETSLNSLATDGIISALKSCLSSDIKRPESHTSRTQ